jgi:hypothetical protein
MMMESGVLRPGDRDIRRGPGGLPLYATRQLSDRLNHSLDVLFGPELKPDQQKMPEAVSWPQPDTPTPSQPASSRFSLKGILIRLGWLDQTNGGSGPESPPPQLLVTQLEVRIQKLDSLLKAEQALCHAQREELSELRAQAKRINILEADLVIERESGARLVHWLQEAEQELADLRPKPSSSRAEGSHGRWYENSQLVNFTPI